jgi:hypothetical protein
MLKEENAWIYGRIRGRERPPKMVRLASVESAQVNRFASIVKLSFRSMSEPKRKIEKGEAS